MEGRMAHILGNWWLIAALELFIVLRVAIRPLPAKARARNLWILASAGCLFALLAVRSAHHLDYYWVAAAFNTFLITLIIGVKLRMAGSRTRPWKR